ncbi:MAG: hypothetical protein KY468_03210 [Armatimonadetes bacterium]|nr:hypothetical protein [Armatimonadota bacterium]
MTEETMAGDTLQDRLRRILEEQPSYVGELAYAADEDLSRTFGKLMCSTHRDQIPPDELMRYLDAFGEALSRVGDRYARVFDYYRRLRCEAVAPNEGLPIASGEGLSVNTGEGLSMGADRRVVSIR